MIWNSGLQNMNSKVNRKGARLSSLLLLGCMAAGILCQGCTWQADNTGAKEKEETKGEEKISVVTTIFPQYDFVREIAGEKVELKMLMKPGEETHSYEPTPQDIIAVQNSDIFIYVGGENDEWVEEILASMPDENRETLKLTDCVDTYEEEHVEGMKEEHKHSHEEEKENIQSEGTKTHSVHEIDEHVWTSPRNAIQIVEAVKELLVKVDERNVSVYEENASDYEEKLWELDAQFQQVVQTSKRKLLLFGDRFPFRYFAEEYGLSYYAAFPGCASDTEPSAATMAFLIDKVKEERIPVILKMELSNADISNAIAEATDTRVETFYSCHNISAEDFENGETYYSMMEKNVETLKEALN